jgi:hypothetical protein
MNSELLNFQHLLTRGIELKRVVGDRVTNCVVYIDPSESSFCCGITKDTDTDDIYSFSDFRQVTRQGNNRLVVVFGDAIPSELMAIPSELIEGSTDAPFMVFTGLTPTLVLQFSSDKVRDYMAKMIPQLMA